MFFGQPCCCYNFASAGALVQNHQGNISIIVNVTNSDEPIVGNSVITNMMRSENQKLCGVRIISFPIGYVPFFIFDIREESERVTSTRLSKQYFFKASVSSSRQSYILTVCTHSLMIDACESRLLVAHLLA